MTCQEMDERLDAWVDGALPEAERREVEAHLDACAGCREEERRLRRLLAHAAAVPRSVSPPRDLWPGIAARIQGAPRHVSWLRFDSWQPALAVAAAVVLALGAVLLGRPSPVPVHTVIIPSSADTGQGRLQTAAVETDPGLAAMEEDYQAAANSLLEALLERQDDLDPQTLETVQRNLAVIDEALAEIHRALAMDPSRPELGRKLVATHRKRIEVLRQMVKLSSALETSWERRRWS
jgi:anti-sigma factor RsiW